MTQLMPKKLASKIMFSIFPLFTHFYGTLVFSKLVIHITLNEPIHLIRQNISPLTYSAIFHNLLNLFI